jgi:mRNA interferase MazF
VEARKVLRGDVFLLDLARVGGRLRKARPVLIVQNDVGNRFGVETIVAAIRDTHGGRMLPVFVQVSKGTAGLVKDSVVDAGQLATVLKEDLGRKLGAMPDGTMKEVSRALAVSLGLALPPH